MKILPVALALFLSLPGWLPVSAGPRDAGSAGARDPEARKQYEQSMEERFRKLGRSLDDLYARAEVLAEQARREAKHALADAEKKRKEAGRKLEELRAESGKRWRKLTADVNAAMDEFEKAYERARQHFRE